MISRQVGRHEGRRSSTRAQADFSQRVDPQALALLQFASPFGGVRVVLFERQECTDAQTLLNPTHPMNSDGS